MMPQAAKFQRHLEVLHGAHLKRALDLKINDPWPKRRILAPTR